MPLSKFVVSIGEPIVQFPEAVPVLMDGKMTDLGRCKAWITCF